MKAHPLIQVAGVMAVLFVASVAAFFLYKPVTPPLPVMGKAPSFELTNEHGQTFSSDGLRGYVWVADFFFTSCPGPCPKMSSNMSKLNRAFESKPKVAMVSISVDPERDNPEILQKYEKRLNAIESSWHFLTGDPAAIHDLSVKGFKIGDPDQLISHSTKFVLVDAKGDIRGYFEGTDEIEIQKLKNAISQLLAET